MEDDEQGQGRARGVDAGVAALGETGRFFRRVQYGERRSSEIGPDYDIAVNASNWALAISAARLQEPR